MNKLGKKRKVRKNFKSKAIAVLSGIWYFIFVFILALIVVMVVIPGSWESKIDKIKEFATSVKTSYTKEFDYETNTLDTLKNDDLNSKKSKEQDLVKPNEKEENKLKVQKIEKINPSENIDYKVPTQMLAPKSTPPNIQKPVNNPNKVKSPKVLASSWYYLQLDEVGKKIYDLIKNQSAYLLEGNHVFDYHGIFTEVLATKEGQKRLERSFQAAINAITLDFPQLFFLNVDRVQLQYTTRGVLGSSVKISNSKEGLYYADGLNNRAEVDAVRLKLDKVVNTIAKNANMQGNSDYAKIKYVHDVLINSIEYDDSPANKGKHNLYGALLNGKAVCEGYAKAFKYIMDRLGIPTITVVGIGINSAGQTQRHAWNQVYINNGWYGVDTTWDDPIYIGNGTVPEIHKHKYFLVGENEFRGNHKPTGNVSPGIYFKYPPLPAGRLVHNR